MANNPPLHGVLIALDVDGTLVNHGHAITQRTLDAIEAAAVAGATLTLATGRDWAMVTDLLDASPALSHALCVNGIEVFERSGRELWAADLNPDAALAAISAVREAVAGAAVGAGINGDFLGEQGISDLMPDGVGEVKVVADIVSHIGPGLRDIVFAHPAYATDVDTLHSMVVEAVGPNPGLDVAFTGLPMIELVPPGAGKHQGLAWLAGHLGIAQDKVIAFGDGQNDLSMLAWAGTGVAMGQAAPNVHEAANQSTAPVTEDGVAAWIESHL